MLIRAAHAADGSAIWDVLRPVFRAGDTYAIDPGISRDDALAYWTQSRAYVAEADGEVLGTYYLKTNQPGGGSHVCNCGFATSPAARGRGVASAMLAHALAEARAAGYRAMQFNFVLETNTGAIRLWQRAGFRQVGVLPGVFLHPEKGYVNALVLHKSLQEP
ncbi:MAG: GNAT family N-acetyltransferase [Rhodobacter sp.]|jgi:ribosomal protein S18 acetylase RimI-like enzyme|nr:GNAT family N-acetyltransferase [Rhodobacter sp.]